MAKRVGRDGLDHSPVFEPRPDIRGEAIFTNMWADLMNGPRDEYGGETPLEVILNDYRFKIGQREATIAASVIGWLGCGCGQSALIRAHDLSKVWDGSRADAYQMAWMHQNRRMRGHNGGMRALEMIMEIGDDYAKVALTAEDVEVADMVWYWLGTEPGQAFLKACEEATIDRSPVPGVLPQRSNLRH